MRRPNRCGWLLIGIAVTLPLACDKAPTSVSQVRREEAPADIPVATASIEEPSAQKPVIAKAELRPAKGVAGTSIELVVEIHILSGWHIYAVDTAAGGAIPTSVVEKLPEGIEAAGAWQYPKAVSAPGTPGRIYEGRLTFRRPLQITERAPAGRIDVSCELIYQACDLFHCLPPQTLNLSARGEVESTH